MLGMERGATRAAALLAACVLGATVQYFLDREHGARRRHLARDRSLARLRRRSRATARRAKYMEGFAKGALYKTARVVPGMPRRHEELDDATLSQKVESIALRAARTPKGRVSINAERGVVYLRGQLDSAEEIESLVRATRCVDGVKGVKNLLHTPGPSPRP